MEILALHLRTTLAQAQAEGREAETLRRLLASLGAEDLVGKVGVGGTCTWRWRGPSGERRDYRLVLKGNQRERLGWAVEVFSPPSSSWGCMR